MRGDRRHELELTGADAKGVALGRLEPGCLRAETVGVVALDAGSVGEEVRRSSHRDRAGDDHSGDQCEHEREKTLRPPPRRIAMTRNTILP